MSDPEEGRLTPEEMARRPEEMQMIVDTYWTEHRSNFPNHGIATMARILEAGQFKGDLLVTCKCGSNIKVSHRIVAAYRLVER